MMGTKKSKRLVGLIHTLGMGGAQRMMITILNYFASQGIETHLIVFDNSGTLKELLSSEVVVHDLGIPSVTKGMPRCLKTIHSIDADVVFTGIGHLNITLAPFVPLMKLLNKKTKWISRETNIVSLQNQRENYPKVFDWLYRHVYKNYDCIIAQSEDMKENLVENYVSSEKIILINNPVNYQKVMRMASEMPSFKLDANKINLLAVSQLREEKRHDLMLEVLSFLPQQYHLTIVGSGEKEERIKHLSKALNLEDRVTFEGQQLNPYVYMQNADLFLLTSEREGFPNVLLEANVLGLPIVAFACKGGIKEIITQGINGFHVPFGACEAMAKQIKEASTFAFDKEKITQMTIKSYSQEVVLEKYRKVFEF